MNQDNLRQHLQTAKTIAVLGASSDPEKAGFYIPDRMHTKGYRILPINPNLAGQQMWGEVVQTNLESITEPVDILNVFRRPETLDKHLAEVLALKPKLVWLQSGIRNDNFAQKLEAAGIPVVQDMCIAVVHRTLLG